MPSKSTYAQRLLATVADHPNDVPLRLRVASMLVTRGFPAEAIAQCTTVLQQDMGNAEALALLSQASGLLLTAPASPGASAPARSLASVDATSRAQGSPGMADSLGTRSAPEARKRDQGLPRATIALPSGERVTTEQMRARRTEEEANYRDRLQHDPENLELLLLLAEVLFKQARYLESAQTYLAAASVSPVSDAPVQGLSRVWRYLRTSIKIWEWSAPPNEIWDVLDLDCPAPIGQEARQFCLATIESRANVNAALTRARDVIGAMVTSRGGQLTELPDPGSPTSTWTDHRADSADYLERDWAVLDFLEAPVRGEPANIMDAGTRLRLVGRNAAEFSQRLLGDAAAGSAIHIGGSDNSGLTEIAVGIRAEIATLSESYRVCGTAVLEFGKAVHRAQYETSRIQHRAKFAIAQQQQKDARLELNPAEIDALRRDTIRGLPAGPFDSSGIASQEAHDYWERQREQILLAAIAAKRQKAQSRWESERQEAIQSATLALGQLATAQARCAEAVHSAISRR